MASSLIKIYKNNLSHYITFLKQEKAFKQISAANLHIMLTYKLYKTLIRLVTLHGSKRPSIG